MTDGISVPIVNSVRGTCIVCVSVCEREREIEIERKKDNATVPGPDSPRVGLTVHIQARLAQKCPSPFSAPPCHVLY